MQLRSYRTTLAAAARLFDEFGFTRFGKMMNRGVRSIAGGNSAAPEINFLDDKEFPSLSAATSSKQSKRKARIDLITSSKQMSEGVPKIGPSQHEASTCSKQNNPLQCEASASISDPYNTDLPTGFWKKKHSSSSRNNNSPLQCEASASITDLCDTDLPTSFGKKQPSSRNQKFRQTNQENREVWRKSKPSPCPPIDEPFDICLPEISNSTTIESYVDFEEDSCSQDIVEESRLILRPGMVLFKNYIPILEQVSIVNRCRELGRGPGGFYRPGYNDGGKLRLYMMCLGLDWNPQTKTYGNRRHHDNAIPPVLPSEFTSLVCRALDDSHTLIGKTLEFGNVENILPTMCPDLCIVNFYTTNGRLGLHQDRDESKESLDNGLPVVSISIGDSAEFLYGDGRDVNKADSVLLESGDILIFGGESRKIFHGVRSIIPDSAPPALLETTKLRPGRLNLTFRKL